MVDLGDHFPHDFLHNLENHDKTKDYRTNPDREFERFYPWAPFFVRLCLDREENIPRDQDDETVPISRPLDFWWGYVFRIMNINIEEKLFERGGTF